MMTYQKKPQGGGGGGLQNYKTVAERVHDATSDIHHIEVETPIMMAERVELYHHTTVDTILREMSDTIGQLFDTNEKEDRKIATILTKFYNRLVEARVPHEAKKMGYIRATVYFHDGRYATGTSSFRLDVTGASAKATNPLEDAETSAVGRAIAFLGYSADKRQGYAIASREEVEEAIRRQEYDAPQAQQVKVEVPDQSKRAKLEARIDEMLIQANEKRVNLQHPHLDVPFDDLTDAEIVELGKYIAEKLK